MTAIPIAPVYGVDYESMCLVHPGPCEVYGPLGAPCDEFQGGYRARWCPRCGWHHRYHPTTDIEEAST